MLLAVTGPFLAATLALTATTSSVVAATDGQLAPRSIPSALLLGQFLPQPGHPFGGDLVGRQLTDNTIPSACRSVCGTTIKIYDACTGSATQSNQETCLSVCQQSIFTEYTSCLQCAVNNVPGGFTPSELSTLQRAINQLADVCADEGKTVSAPSLTAASGSGSASQTGTPSFTSASSSSTSAASTSVPAGVTATAPGASAPAATSQSGSIKAHFPGASAGLAMAVITLSTVCVGLLAV